MARNTNMHRSDMQWPLRLWRAVRHAAVDEDLSVTVWLHRAAREQLKRQGQPDPDTETAEVAA